MITPSDMQWAAIRAAVKWFKEPPATRKPFLYIGGYAGAGKSEIAKFIIQELGLQPGEFTGMAFSGKAALMMKVRGFPEASTIHSNIYQLIERGKGRVPELEELLKKLELDKALPYVIERVRKEIRDEMRGLRQMGWSLRLESDIRELKLIVLDEVSQVGATIAEDLLSFGVPLLVLGDPGQLPPVADAGFFTKDAPDIFLTEIHRQARDSAVIRMATQAREEGWVTPGVYHDPSGFESIASYVSDSDRTLSCTQILVGRNATRHAVNAWVRSKKGFTSLIPMAGEKLICLRNDHDIGILNGGFFETLEDAVETDNDCVLLKIKSLDFLDREPVDVLAHKILFGGDKEQLKPWAWNEAQCFDYGYACTVHKYQGSQAEHVVVNAEWPNKETWKNWLYTSVTRAQLSNYIKLPR